MALDPAFAIVHVPAERRFVLQHQGTEAGELTYAVSGGRAALLHTEVRPALRGRGLAHELVLATVAWARGEGLKLTPMCSYTRVVLERSAEFEDVL